MATLASGSAITFGIQGDQTITLDTSAGTEGSVSWNAPNGTVSHAIGPTPFVAKVIRTNGVSGSATITSKNGAITYSVSASQLPVYQTDPLTGEVRLQTSTNSLQLSNSVKTVLFGDSMTDTYETVASGSNGVYNVSTGDLVLTITGHQQAVGWYITVWNRVFASTLKQFRVQVASVTDANTLTVNIGAGLAGVVTDANWFVRPESWRSAQAFVPWLQAVSGQRFNIVYNGAQSGDTTQNALDRLQRDCLAYNPSVVIMQIPGINDTSTGNGNIAEDTIFANQKSIVTQIAATNAKLILLSMTPPAAGDGRSTLVNMIRVIRINQRLQAFVASMPNVIWFDAFKRIVDPANAAGAALTNFIRTTDKIHYSMRGGKYIADQLWAQISSIFPTDNTTLPTSVIDSYTNSALTLDRKSVV